MSPASLIQFGARKGIPLEESPLLLDTSFPTLIVRLAGLPAEALLPLASPSCKALLDSRQTLLQELAQTRQRLSEAIEEALVRFDAPARRFLLAIKRNCFNSREIGKYREKSEWQRLRQVSPDLPDQLVSLEDRLLQHDRGLEALYIQESSRERRHILGLTQDPCFLRGVALGRPGLVEKIRARAPALLASETLKRSEKWEQSLLRFATRATVKLSANSTLTTYALGRIEASPSPPSLRYLGTSHREISLVRTDRRELEQFQSLLVQHPAVRQHCYISWNDSLKELEPGYYEYLRDGHWSFTTGASGFHFVSPARIKARLSATLLSVAREALQGGPLRYDALLTSLKMRGEISQSDPASLHNPNALEHLVNLGALVLSPPWPTYEPRLEQTIAQFLRTLSADPTLHATLGALEYLLELQRTFTSDRNPDSTVKKMQGTFSQLVGTVAPTDDPSLNLQPGFFEDVLLTTTIGCQNDPSILCVAASEIQEIFQTAVLVSRFAAAFNHRHDILHALAAWWREHHAGRREAPFAEIAQGFAPFWKQFLQFHKTANDSALNTFDPLLIPTLESLREIRGDLLTRSADLIRASINSSVLPRQPFAELLAMVPRRYAPLLGPSVFVQPIDSEAISWVMNRLSEGTGRYLSRVTPILADIPEYPLLDHLTARSFVVLDGEEVDFLEVKYPWGNLVTAHEPQAFKVLGLRGLHFDLPKDQVVDIGQLRLQADLASETFRLCESSGRRLLPVHLSSMTDASLPSLLRFLLIFGPGETRGVFPFPYSQGDETLRSFERLTCGNLVLRRRRWEVRITDLRNQLEGLSDVRAHALLHDWHRRLGIPSTFFFYERTYQGAFKPQYIELSSPSLCSLLLESLRRKTFKYLFLEEALPSPSSFPLDVTGRPRGVELLIDSLATRTATETSLVAYRNIIERAHLSERS